MDGILGGIAKWIGEAVLGILDLFSSSILDAFGMDMSTFIAYIPASKLFAVAFTSIGVGIVLFNLIWQLFKNYGFVVGEEAEPPVQLVLRSLLFLFLLGNSKHIFDIVLRIGATPYNWVNSVVVTVDDGALFTDLINNITGVLSLISGAGAIFFLVVALIIGYNFLKLLVEAGQRYVILCFIRFLGPIFIGLGSSKATSKIFESYCRMFAGQMLLLILNVWSIKMFNSMVATFVATGGTTVAGGNIFLWVIFAVAFLKASQQIDTLLSMVGFNTPKVNSSLMEEALVGGRAMAGLSKMGIKNADAVTGSSGSAKEQSQFLSGGAIGTIGRQVQNAGSQVTKMASKSATDSSSGLGGKVSDKLFKDNDNYAMKGISKVATDDAGKYGSITGEKGTKAMDMYFGNNSGSITNSASVGTSNVNSTSKPKPTVGSSGNNVGVQGTTSSSTPIANKNTTSEKGRTNDTSSVSASEGIPIKNMENTQEQIPNSKFGAMTREELMNMSPDDFDTLDTGVDEPFEYPTTDSQIPIESGNITGDSNDIATSSVEMPQPSVDSNFNNENVDTINSVDIPHINNIDDVIENVDAQTVATTIAIDELSSIEDRPSVVGQVQDISQSGNDDSSNSIVTTSDSSNSTVVADISISPTIANNGNADITESNPTISSNNEAISSNSYVNKVENQSNLPSESVSPVLNSTEQSIPVKYSNIEMGNGRITGYENGKEFAMYNTNKYDRPQNGEYTTETSNDGETWYKQYAQPTVIKTPTKDVDDKGKVIMNEKVVDKLPSQPSTTPPKKKR